MTVVRKMKYPYTLGAQIMAIDWKTQFTKNWVFK